MVVCKLFQCPYFDKGFCSNKITIIDENGHCGHIWRKGTQRLDAFNKAAATYKKEIIITDAEWRKPSDTEECGSAKIERSNQEGEISARDNQGNEKSAGLASESTGMSNGDVG